MTVRILAIQKAQGNRMYPLVQNPLVISSTVLQGTRGGPPFPWFGATLAGY
jgi:hypothetical protein